MSLQALIDYTLHLGDNALVLGHRNSEWTGHGPILEQDIALSNIALDLIGQARNWYQYSARLINTGGVKGMGSGGHERPPGGGGSGSGVYLGAGGHERAPGRGEAGGNGHSGSGVPAGLPGYSRQPGVEVTEDALAYLRDAWDFRNCLLVEQVNGDWGKTVLRQFFFSAYQFYFYQTLERSRDKELSAIAEKSLKEVTYHLRWSSEWVIRLGDGTEESHSRMERAMDELWKFTGELFLPSDYERALSPAGIAVDLADIRWMWEERVEEVLKMAQLRKGAGDWMQTGGKQGKHTEHLGYLLAEMQFLQRAYPGCEW